MSHYPDIGNGNQQDFYAPPPPPAHREFTHSTSRPTPAYPGQSSYQSGRNPFNDSNATISQMQSSHSTSSITPEMDNLGGAAAGGGISGIAMGVADANQRESGLQAARGMQDSDSSFSGYTDHPHYTPDPLARNPALQRGSSPYVGDGFSTPYATRSAEQGMPFNAYASPVHEDGPYKRYSTPWDHTMGPDLNPDEIEDDGDDGLGPANPVRRKSVLGFGTRSGSNLAEGAAVGAATGGVVGALRNVSGTNHPQGNYGPVSTGDMGGSSAFEKREMLASEAAARKRKRLIFIILAIVAILAIIGAGVGAGIVASRKNSSSISPANTNGGAETAAQDDGSGDLDINSSEIQQLMNNKDLHRVFPGIDYTPFNAQYPDCLTNPPSQNNVTRDVAVLSQLTKTIRLYGTDCNQTDMVLHSLNQLKITDMKVWLGVWLNNNQTTNTRGMNAMYDILKRNGQDPFVGVIIGNEVLYRQDMTMEELSEKVQGVRSNFTELKYTLPIAVADLGDNWKADLVEDVDVVMSNVHPFFAGVTADQASGWTWDFWQQHDVILTASNSSKKNIISETGWPSDGGNDCGAGTCTSKTQGSVAGIDEMNTFMSNFVCQSLKNGTDYFWFEAFDEPWKVIFNTNTDQWETKWGLMDPGRNLKPGVQIPDCGGQSV